MENKLTVYVAAHKEVERYISDCYQLLHVGAANATADYGYLRDDTKENISSKNPYWCELTGLYWIWKNVSDEKNIGFCHYRRYPSKNKYALNSCAAILRETEMLELLDDCDILLPYQSRKCNLNSRCKTKADLEKSREYLYIRRAMQKYEPSYLQELDECFLADSMCFGNIFITSKKILDQYCEWLFNLLFSIEEDVISCNDLRPRELGYLSEWLLNVWVKHNKLKVKYISTVFMEEKKDLKFYVKMILERMGRHK